MDSRTKRIVIVVMIFLTLFIFIAALGFADDGGLDAWVLCPPGQIVYLYEEPSETAETTGRCRATDRIRLDGTYRNGYARCEKGWVSVTCIVTEKPEWENGRWYTVKESTVAWSGFEWKCAGVIDKGTNLQVFWRSAEYCVTTRGMIRTKDLEEEICPTCN